MASKQISSFNETTIPTALINFDEYDPQTIDVWENYIPLGGEKQRATQIILDATSPFLIESEKGQGKTLLIHTICKENNIIVISDEIYTELDFNGNYHSISHFYPEGTIISSGLSKWCGAGGWRLGTLTFPKELKIIHDSVRSLASETFTSVSAPIQYAAVKAFTEDHSEYLNNSRTILKKVADFVYDQLSEIGIECIRPQGGFYILCDFSKIIKHNNIINNATTLCEQVLQNTGFAMLPGKNFGIEDEKLITRMAFVDFDGNKALSFMKDNTLIKDDDFNELFPKINEGILNLKSWLKSEFLS